MNDDTISRKSVIDAVHTATYRFICGAEDGDEMTDADILVLSINKAVCTAIKALPTEHPDMSGNMSGTHISSDCISRQAVINEMKDMYTAAEEWGQGAHDDDTKARAESCMATNVELKLRIEQLPSVQPEPLTDKEQRIFLSAMGREEEVCKEVDDAWRDCREPYEDSLVHVCKEIRRKVKGALWT